MPKGDLLRKHSGYFQTVLDSLAELHKQRVCTAELSLCSCDMGQAWKFFRKQWLELEKSLLNGK